MTGQDGDRPLLAIGNGGPAAHPIGGQPRSNLPQPPLHHLLVAERPYRIGQDFRLGPGQSRHHLVISALAVKVGRG